MCTNIRMRVCVCVFLSVYARVWIFVRVCARMCVAKCMRVCSCIRTYVPHTIKEHTNIQKEKNGLKEAYQQTG